MLVRKEFIKWLEKNKHKHVCTRAYQERATQHCPLANFLRSKHPRAVVSIYANSGYVNQRHFVLPDWARSFIRAFDSYMDGRSARGSTALRVLRDV